MNDRVGEVATKTDELLALFDGDVEAAVAALKNRTQVQPEPDGFNLESSEAIPQRSDTPIISVQSVTKKYKVGKELVQALSNVSLDIYPGEIVAITGPSGSGKSTLLHILGCLDKPSEGRVLVDTQDVSKLSDGRLSQLRRSTIGFIFQSFYLQPFLRLRDNVAVPAMFTRERRRVINDGTTKLLEQVGLIDRQNHFPKELSGGQIQRAAIARALVNKPKIILADEPTGNLDSANSEAIIDLFKTIRDQLGTTVVIVTHNAEVAHQADRVIRLKDGVVQ